MNSFGRLFKLNIYGESHGSGIGVIIDGIPSGIQLTESDFISDILRRKAGKIGTTKRIENDNVQIISGVYENYTTGAPINLYIQNESARPSEYRNVLNQPRPGHADFTAMRKYNNYNDFRGGGQLSGRMTAIIVAAGVIAKKMLKDIYINANIKNIGGYTDYEEAIQSAIKEGNTLGGLIECKIENLPVGIGEPFFDSLESMISHIIFSIPGIKAIEFGKGFESQYIKGDTYNDSYINEDGETITNYSGGINGGISNGNEIVFKVAAKPPSSISMKQKTWDYNAFDMTNLEIKGRHDVSFALRLPPIIEAAAALAIADLWLIDKALYR